MSDTQEILIVDDEELICFVLSNLFKVHGYKTRTASNGEEALAMINERLPSLLILDIRMPGLSGVDVLYRVKQMDVHVPIVLMTALAGVRDAVQAMKAGAFDYIAKPFNNEDMLHVVRRALASTMARPADLESGHAEEPGPDLDTVIASMGTSGKVRDLAERAASLAKANDPVLVTGETGTGKKMTARALHAMKPGVESSFFVVDCTGTGESLLLEELFGIEEPGADGGAVLRKGKLELAGDGTVLVDEVGECSRRVQERLAEVIATGAITRVNGIERVPVSCRLVISSSSTIATLEKNGDIIPDLLRLVVEQVLHVPALRERKEDIPYLSQIFIESANKELQKSVAGYTTAAMEMLSVYDWPGNVHQLKSTIRRAVLHAGELIDVDDLEIPNVTRFHRQKSAYAADDGEVALKDQVRRHIAEIERQMILETLQKTGWNKAKASRMLQITYKTMLKKVQEYNLEDPRS